MKTNEASPPKDVHKSPEFKIPSKQEESQITIEEDKRAAASPALPKFHLSNDGASVNYREPLKTDRPKNVYIEIIDGKYWLWYNTERSQEIGINRNFVTDEKTQIKSEYGYDCNIPATKQNIGMLRELTFAGTQYLFKDSMRRTVIDLDKFIAEAKL